MSKPPILDPFPTNYKKMKAYYEKHAAKAAGKVAAKKPRPKKKPKVKPREEFWLAEEWPFDAPWGSPR